MAQKIERRSFDLILYLLKLEGRVASKDELLEHVWGNHFLSESVIAQSIMKVRKALGITGKEPGPIKTIHRVGYRFASEVRKAMHSASPDEAPPGHTSPTRILWLPTDCDMPRADLSWVRYGLISVATHVLHAQGVPTVPASKAIRLHESRQVDGGHSFEDHGPDCIEPGIPMVRSRMTASGEHFRLQWWMQMDGFDHGNQLEGPAPAELALQAAREVALIARMRTGHHLNPGHEATFWEESSALVALAVSLEQTDKALPLMATCVEMTHCPLPIWAEFLLVMAQRADDATPELAQRLVHLARSTHDCAHEGWALLCDALHRLYRQQTTQAVSLAMSGVALVRHAAPHALYARALLLATHVLATAGKASEANVLWRDANTFVSQAPTPNLVCHVHLRQCEQEHMAPGQTRATNTPVDAMASIHWLGLTPVTAQLHVFQALQSGALGELEVCRSQLQLGLNASEKGGYALPRLFAYLHMGSLHARCGDQGGLVACMNAVDQPALRSAPMGGAVSRWLQSRWCHMTGEAARALSLADAAMEEMADFGVWCAEDHWLYVAQVALVAGNRRAARALLLRLQGRHALRPLQARQVTALAVEGMIEYAEGNASKALVLFEQACRLARGNLMANILLFGHTWLALIDGRNPSPAMLAPAGQWVQATREGRHIRAMLLNKPYWAMGHSKQLVLLGTGARPMAHRVADVGEGGLSSYAHYLPMPV